MILRTPRDFSLRIRERRHELRWSQQTLANAAGVSRWFVIEVEKGKGSAEFGLVLKVLRALGLVMNVKVTAPDPGLDGDVREIRRRRADRFRRGTGRTGGA